MVIKFTKSRKMPRHRLTFYGFRYDLYHLDGIMALFDKYAFCLSAPFCTMGGKSTLCTWSPLRRDGNQLCILDRHYAGTA